MKRLLLIFLLTFSVPVKITAQKNTEALKAKASSLIYEQPEKAISLALQLLKSEKKVDEVANLYMIISNAYIAKKIMTVLFSTT